jgi:hypothetical protein
MENTPVDVEMLAKLLDTALASDSPMVKEQLQKLLMVAALCSSPVPLAKAVGPFEGLFQEMKALRREVRYMQDDMNESMSRGKKTATMIRDDYERAMMTRMSQEPSQFSPYSKRDWDKR